MQAIPPSLLDWPRRALAFLGRYGAQGFALSIVLSFALQRFSGAVKPFLGALIFCFVAINTMRADWPALRRLAGRPWRVAAALVLSTLAPFVTVAAIVAILGRDAFEPGLLLGLAIAAAAPPLVAAPAYALLLGFSNALPLTLLALGMAIAPVVSPLIADVIVGAAVPLDRIALMGRLAIFLFGAMTVGLAARRLIGGAWIAARSAELNGLGVVLFFLFAVALTESLATAAMEQPLRAALYLGVGFGVSAIAFMLALFAWLPVDRMEAAPLAITAGLRNTGLLIAALGVNEVPPETFLFFALLQFPIYFAPQIVKPFLRLIHGRAAEPRV
ncbi:MAG: hypothetical protein J0H41_15760 [Rhizobiales bacterium]|nr:hypothetical protein [Hyphomicrobiales bacterium]